MRLSVVCSGIFLLLHLAGCTAYRPADIPGNYSLSETRDGEQQELAIGDTVRVTITSGNIYTGNIVTLSSDEIVLGKKGNFGYEEQAINLSEIVTIEVEGPKGAFGLLGDTLLITAVVVGVSFFAIFGGGGPGS